MIINNAPAQEAVLSNVGEIGEFRIRNSAKAFNILSSGLYANKIKAIIRELSCNAVDSHTAAGKQDVPFDVHLPTTLEPWFSIRDYGTGLTHDQVTQIYTTYFESTKTDSNEFIGALGLGSKSPFSYTDNFTVTAVKDGVKGIYSAFINASGVPSIAQMMTEETGEPAGVEVKFSVNDRWDFSKFRQEARDVYTYFKLRPVVTGDNDFEFRDVTYQTRDIIPGVHELEGRRYHSVALMGNIAYPIDVPNASDNLGDLARLLNCGLEMHFEIGELDFQASREGLSYIPQTIDSIKKKLMALTDKLATFVADEANKIDNLWERAIFLDEKKNSDLWANAVEKYVADSKFALMEVRPGYTPCLTNLTQTVENLAKRFNIAIRAFTKTRGSVTVSTHTAHHNYDRTKTDKDGNYLAWTEWAFSIAKSTTFVINDLKVGATERAKYHFRTNTGNDNPYSRKVYVLEAADKTKPINTKAFFRAIKNPPADQIMLASTLDEKERAVSGPRAKNVSIMRLEERGSGGYYRRDDLVWRDAGKLDTFNDTDTYYYLPITGFKLDSDRLKSVNCKELVDNMRDCGVPGMKFAVFGVRKSDLETIKTLPNWINAEDRIIELLNAVTEDTIKSMAMGLCDRSQLIQFNAGIMNLVTNAKSPYSVVSNKVRNAQRTECNAYDLDSLCKLFGVTIDVESAKQAILDESAAIYARYPLLTTVMYRADDAAIADYINMCDKTKGVK